MKEIREQVAVSSIIRIASGTATGYAVPQVRKQTALKRSRGPHGPSPAPPTTRFRWAVVALLFLAPTVNYVDRAVLGVLKPLVPTRNPVLAEIVVVVALRCYPPDLCALSWRSLLVVLLSTVRTRVSLQLEILALRHQLGVLQRTERRWSRLKATDRLVWVALRRLCPSGASLWCSSSPTR